MLLVARLPEFPPEPPKIESEVDVLKPEVPFEKYVYLKVGRCSRLLFSLHETSSASTVSLIVYLYL